MELNNFKQFVPNEFPIHLQIADITLRKILSKKYNIRYMKIHKLTQLTTTKIRPPGVTGLLQLPTGPINRKRNFLNNCAMMIKRKRMDRPVKYMTFAQKNIFIRVKIG